MAFEFRTYDPRVGRFLSTDPLTATTPWETPYAFAGNSPVANIDYLGLSRVPVAGNGSPPAGGGGSGANFWQGLGNALGSIGKALLGIGNGSGGGGRRAPKPVQTYEMQQAVDLAKDNSFNFNQQLNIGDPKRKNPDPRGLRHKKMFARYNRIFARKVGRRLMDLNNNNATDQQITDLANELADRYQHRRWFRYFAKYSVTGGTKKKVHTAKDGTGWTRTQRIILRPLPSVVTVNLVARNGMPGSSPNNQMILRNMLIPGSTITANFTPFNQVNSLSIFALDANNILIPILNSGGMTPLNAGNQVFVYNGIVPQNIGVSQLAIQVNDPTAIPGGLGTDRWNLQVQIRRPFSVDPAVIMTTQISSTYP